MARPRWLPPKIPRRPLPHGYTLEAGEQDGRDQPSQQQTLVSRHKLDGLNGSNDSLT